MRIRVKTPDQVFIYDIKNETTSIGRSDENDFILPLTDLSRKHCLVTLKGEYVFIMDLGSKNGVSLDGEKITPHEQFPIYTHSKVMLADQFEFILANVTNTEQMAVRLNGPLKRKG